MKKLLVCATLVSGLAVTGLSFASAAPMMQQANSTFTGAYAGVDAGFRTVDYTFKNAVNGQYVSNTQTVTQSVEGLHAGYGYQFANNLYLGAQGFAQIAQGDSRNNDNDSTSTTQFGNTYGLNAQLGYAVTNRFLPYVTGGYEWLKIKDDSITNPGGVHNYSIDKTKGGFDAGAGMKFKVAEHMFANAEVTGAWISRASTSSANASVQPNVYTGLVGLSYLF